MVARSKKNYYWGFFLNNALNVPDFPERFFDLFYDSQVTGSGYSHYQEESLNLVLWAGVERILDKSLFFIFFHFHFIPDSPIDACGGAQE